MSGTDWQGVLWEEPDGPGHLFYITSNQYVYKPGRTANIRRRMRDPQFKGHRLGVLMVCHCTLRDGVCKHEETWARHARADRIPNSEQYGRSERTDTMAEGFVRFTQQRERGHAWLQWVLRVRIDRSA